MVHLEDFKDYMAKNLEKFFDQYQANHEVEPNDWPLEMNFAEWLEQFEMWNE